jgi:hypothetical protein
VPSVALVAFVTPLAFVSFVAPLALVAFVSPDGRGEWLDLPCSSFESLHSLLSFSPFAATQEEIKNDPLSLHDLT